MPKYTTYQDYITYALTCTILDPINFQEIYVNKNLTKYAESTFKELSVRKQSCNKYIRNVKLFYSNGEELFSETCA